MERTVVIGDIHGCLDAFNALIKAIEPSSNDTIVTVGDYVDRGPNSKGVIDRLLELREVCQLVTLRGNHEDMMLEVLRGEVPPFSWLNHGGVQTMDSYGFVGDLGCVPRSHRDFLENLPSFFENETHFVVHANYDPDLPLEEQPDDLLRWVKLTQEVPGPHMSGKRAIVGHTHDREGRIIELPHLICIDTYCYGGKWLTAMELETGRVWQADPYGKLLTPPAP